MGSIGKRFRIMSDISGIDTLQHFNNSNNAKQ